MSTATKIVDVPIVDVPIVDVPIVHLSDRALAAARGRSMAAAPTDRYYHYQVMAPGLILRHADLVRL